MIVNKGFNKMIIIKWKTSSKLTLKHAVSRGFWTHVQAKQSCVKSSDPTKLEAK